MKFTILIEAINDMILLKRNGRLGPYEMIAFLFICSHEAAGLIVCLYFAESSPSVEEKCRFIDITWSAHGLMISCLLIEV